MYVYLYLYNKANVIVWQKKQQQKTVVAYKNLIFIFKSSIFFDVL